MYKKVFIIYQRNKERDLTLFYDKSPYTNKKFQKGKMTTQNATTKLDYTTIEDRIMTVSWSNDSHPTGVVKE